jgi:hypothetical protein
MVRIHGFGQRKIRVGIEPVDQFFALVILIGAGFVVIDFVHVIFPLGAGVGVVVAVTQQSHGPGRFQAGLPAVGMGLPEGLVGPDGHALGLIEADAPGRMKSIGRDQDEVLDQVGLLDGPLHGLLAPQGTADDGMDPADAQLLAQQLMRPDHIPDGNRREGLVIRLPCFRILAQRTGGTVTGSQDVGADNKVLFRIK